MVVCVAMLHANVGGWGVRTAPGPEPGQWQVRGVRWVWRSRADRSAGRSGGGIGTWAGMDTGIHGHQRVVCGK